MGDSQQGRPGAAAHKILSADEILAVDDLPVVDFPVPEWGGTIKVRGLSVHAMNEANRKATVAGDVDPEKITVQVLIEGIVEPKFSDDQRAQLAEKSTAVVNRIGGKIFELSGISGEQLASAEARFREGAA